MVGWRIADFFWEKVSKSKQFQSVDSVYVLPIGKARVRLLERCGVGMSTKGAPETYVVIT